MDKLEKYVSEHREQFDNRTPDNTVWERIEGDLDKQGGRRWLTGSIMWKAASVVLLLTVIGLIADRYGKITDLNQMATNENVDLREVENYYSNIILARQEQIKEYINQYPELDQRFLNDLNRLDESYKQLKTELETGYSEKIVNAMIVNLQLRIDVLNQQMEIIENIKNLNKDETVNI